MEGKEKCGPEVPKSHQTCIRSPGVPSYLGKEDGLGWCSGTGQFFVRSLNVCQLGQDSRASSLSAMRLLGALTIEEWALREQNTINSTIWLLLPIRTPFNRRNDYLVVGHVLIYSLFAGCWIERENPPWEHSSNTERSSVSSKSVLSYTLST